MKILQSISTSCILIGTKNTMGGGGQKKPNSCKLLLWMAPYWNCMTCVIPLKQKKSFGIRKAFRLNYKVFCYFEEQCLINLEHLFIWAKVTSLKLLMMRTARRCLYLVWWRIFVGLAVAGGVWLSGLRGGSFLWWPWRRLKSGFRRLKWSELLSSRSTLTISRAAFTFLKALALVQ